MDTVDWAERICASHLCEKYKKAGIEEFGYGKGYAYLAEEILKFLLNLTELQESGMHVVLLAHSAIRKLELSEEVGAYDHYELKCSKGVAALIKEWADGVLFLNYRTIVQTDANGKGKGIGGKERVLYAAHTAFCDAKSRWGLPDVLPLENELLGKIFSPKSSEKSTGKTPLEQLKTLMELTAVSEEELNAFLRGFALKIGQNGLKFIKPKKTSPRGRSKNFSLYRLPLSSAISLYPPLLKPSSVIQMQNVRDETLTYIRQSGHFSELRPLERAKNAENLKKSNSLRY